MHILTNFMNSPKFIDLPGGGRAALTCSDDWRDFRKLLTAADLVVIDCRDSLIYQVAARFLLLPWQRRLLVAVDLVLRKPQRLRHRLTTPLKRLLLMQVDHFIHYFKDISGYARYFGISAARSSYVPFKVNIPDVRRSATDVREDYIIAMGVSLRDYDTFIRAVAQLPYPAAIPEFSFEHFEGRDRSFTWTRQNLPPNLTVLPDTGKRDDLTRNLSRARVVVIPTQANSLCASGLSTYLAAMHLGKCVISSTGPGASDLLTDQALLVPPHDVVALRDAIRRAWEDDALRARIAASGHQYALSLGGEAEFLQRLYQQCFTSLGLRE